MGLSPPPIHHDQTEVIFVRATAPLGAAPDPFCPPLLFVRLCASSSPNTYITTPP